MSAARTIAHNAAFYTVGEVLARIFSFFFIVALARMLGPEGLGQYSFAFAFASIFLMLTDFGLSLFLIKEVAKNRARANELLSDVFSLKLILLTLSTILVVAFVAITAKSINTVEMVAIVSVAMLFNLLAEPFRNIFIAFEKQGYYALVVTVDRALSVGLGLFALYTIGTVISVFWASAIAYLITLILVIFLVRFRFTKFTLSIRWSNWIRLLKRSWPFWFSFLFMTLFFRVDTIMITLFKGYEPVGFYNASYKLVESLTFLPLAITGAMFPAMSKLFITKKDQLYPLFQRALYYLLVLAMPIVTGTIMLADRIILMMYGSEFQNSTIVLQILIIAEGFIFLTFVLGTLLNAIDKQVVYTCITVVYGLLNVIFNAIVIPTYSYTGAAVVSVVTQGIGLAALFYMASRYGYRASMLTRAIRPLVATIAMAAAIYLLSSLNLLIVIPLSGAIYFAVLFLLGGFNKEEIDFLKRLIRIGP